MASPREPLQGIPAPPQWPVLGHLFRVPRTRLSQHMLELSRRFDGIFELNFAGIRVPIVYGADLVAEVCDEKRFRKVIRPPLLFLRDIGGDGLFTAHRDEPNWERAHRILMPAFGSRAMKGYFPRMLDVAQQLVASWEARAGSDILVADDMTRLTLDTIALTGFDYRFDSFASERLHPFIESMVRVLSDAMTRLTRLPIQNRWANRRAYHADVALMNRLVDEVIRGRRARPVATDDLLNLMLNATDPQTGEKLDDVNIRYQVITFLIAGHETTSGLLTFALYLLLRHPQVLAQAYAEVDRVLPADTVPEHAHLARLEVIERVLKETLRLWPTAPGFNLAPYEETVIGGRYRIRKDQTMLVSLPALHRDSRVWRDPESFDIDRFLPEAEARLPRHAYKPFGNGERACIGRQFALTEAKLALAVILQHFDLSDPHDYRLTIKETLTLKPDRFYLRARRRRPHERIAVPAAGDAPAQPADSTAPARVHGAGARFTVLYGTNLGSSREVAEHVCEQAQHLGFDATVAPLDDYAGNLPEDGVLVVVTATYNGQAPDSARALAARIGRGELAQAPRPNLRYAVLGCGDSQWPDYQAFPTLVERALSATGAAALVERGEADANGDFDAAAERWLDGLWQALGESPGAREAAGPRVAVKYASTAEAMTGLLPPGARALTVASNEELVHDPTGLWDFSLEAPRASTRHLVLRLPEGMSYRTGDHFGVYPRNRPERVAAVLEHLGLAPETVVVLESEAPSARHLPLGKPVTAAQLLRDFVELQDPVTRNDVRRLLPYAGCPHTRAQLEALIAEDEPALARFQQEITDRRVSAADLLARHSALRPPLEVFLDACPPRRPRFYSISSSAAVSPGALALTVGTVSGRAWAGEGEYQGVASSYLRDLAPGERVTGYLRTPEPPFAPPADARVPMILVGPGTGFAPFRGFLEERAAQQQNGLAVARSLVFYGCRHPEHDWLYREEMRRWAAQGVAELHLAFSTVPSHPHRFVQDALWDARAAVWAALEQGATVYVCGDGRLMAPAVRDTLIRIHMEITGSARERASAWLQELIKSARYRQDIYGDS